MRSEPLILSAEVVLVYLVVLGGHALRHRLGLSFFYTLLGGLTALMSWVTDAGVAFRVGGVTFVVGSTVLYTSLLLGVFVVYVFDGSRAARTSILAVAAVSALAPLVAAALHLQARLSGVGALPYVPVPSLRINAASVATTLVDMVALAVAWEYLGRPRIHLWLRTWLALLGVMGVDVILFNTLAFGGSGAYLQILPGTAVSRLVMSLVSLPFLAAYLNWQTRLRGQPIENRPVLAILQRVAQVEAELSQAQREILRREAAEEGLDRTIQDLRRALSEVKTLRGLLPICSRCKRIRDDTGYWRLLEEYLKTHTEAQLTHGICPTCARELYPDIPLNPPS